jgi:hypothetical protein
MSPSVIYPRSMKDLVTAVSNGNTEGMREALRSGADIDACHQSGDTALTTAVDMGHLDAVRFLLEARADVVHGATRSTRRCTSPPAEHMSSTTWSLFSFNPARLGLHWCA